MGLLARKINHDLIEEKIPFGYPTEPPALVQTVGARLEFLELFGAFWRELASVYEFFQFRVHFQECTNYDERSRWRGKSLLGVCVEYELWDVCVSCDAGNATCRVCNLRLPRLS